MAAIMLTGVRRIIGRLDRYQERTDAQFMQMRADFDSLRTEFTELRTEVNGMHVTHAHFEGPLAQRIAG